MYDPWTQTNVGDNVGEVVCRLEGNKAAGGNAGELEGAKKRVDKGKEKIGKL